MNRLNPKEEFAKLAQRLSETKCSDSIKQNVIQQCLEEAYYLGYQEAKQECDDWIERHEKQ